MPRIIVGLLMMAMMMVGLVEAKKVQFEQAPATPPQSMDTKAIAEKVFQEQSSAADKEDRRKAAFSSMSQGTTTLLLNFANGNFDAEMIAQTVTLTVLDVISEYAPTHIAMLAQVASVVVEVFFAIFGGSGPSVREIVQDMIDTNNIENAYTGVRDDLEGLGNELAWTLDLLTNGLADGIPEVKLSYLLSMNSHLSILYKRVHYRCIDAPEDEQCRAWQARGTVSLGILYVTLHLNIMGEILRDEQGLLQQPQIVLHKVEEIKARNQPALLNSARTWAAVKKSEADGDAAKCAEIDKKSSAYLDDIYTLTKASYSYTFRTDQTADGCPDPYINVADAAECLSASQSLGRSATGVGDCSAFHWVPKGCFVRGHGWSENCFSSNTGKPGTGMYKSICREAAYSACSSFTTSGSCPSRCMWHGDTSACKVTCASYTCTTSGWVANWANSASTTVTEANCCQAPHIYTLRTDQTADGCPDPYINVADAAECLSASQSLGRSATGVGNCSAFHWVPKGCFVRGHGWSENCFSSNTGEPGTLMYKSICRKTCSLFTTSDSCPSSHCTWNSGTCEARSSTAKKAFGYVGCVQNPTGWTRLEDVALSEDGARECKAKCFFEGYTGWGLECPQGTKVHCQCITASSLSSAGTPIGEENCRGGGPLNFHHCTGPYEKNGFFFGASSVSSIYSTSEGCPRGYSQLGRIGDDVPKDGCDGKSCEASRRRKQNTQALCAEECDQTEGCGSFEYGYEGDNCQLLTWEASKVEYQTGHRPNSVTCKKAR